MIGLSNGDFAVGGSDGLIRVFTRALERSAAAEMIAVGLECFIKALILKHFEEAVATQAIPSQVFIKNFKRF